MSSSESDETLISDSDSETDFESDQKFNKKRKKKVRRPSDHESLSTSKISDRTSSLNPHYICDACGIQYKYKCILVRHITKKKCEQKVNVCRWCNVEFRNRGNLATHAKYMHGDTSYSVLLSKEAIFNCKVCKNRKFAHNYQLKYHIRKEHMNLKAKIPYAEVKKVNQVWFEKVMNTDTIMEIKKAGVNTLIMRPLDENTKITVKNDNVETIDLSDIYPIGVSNKKEKKECTYCKKIYVAKDLKKHIEEVHLNIKRFLCNNCNRTFKRNYHYVQHFCNRTRRVKGVTQGGEGIVIASVESLSIPLGL